MAEEYYLKAVAHSQTEKSGYRIRQLPCTIGRGKHCNLDIALDQVSRQHARLDSGADGLTIEDLGSTNGTFVNHDRISGSVPITPGDRIHLGSHEFLLSESGTDIHTQPTDSPQAANVSAGHTILGFTAEPTGFPVQAPEFYELLNDEAVAIQTAPITGLEGRTRAICLKAVSRHAEIDAGHDELQRLAGQLGEEARLNQIIRQHALESAEENAIDDQPLILTAHPNELEDIDLLEDELKTLMQKFVRVQLALEVSITDAESAWLDALTKVLNKLDIIPVFSDINPADSKQLKSVAVPGAWLVIDGRSGPKQFKALIDNPAINVGQIIADRIDDQQALEGLRDLPDIWIRGQAVGEPTVLEIQV